MSHVSDMAPALWRFFRAPRTALVILLFHFAYATAAVWIDALTFSSPVFLIATLLLFISTAVCTIERTLLNVKLTRGVLRTYGDALPRRPGHDVRAFLHSQGFRGEGTALFRWRSALWGGSVLHAGVLVLILGVLVQRSLHDSGGFQLTEGEQTRLSEREIIGRDHGPFAPAKPPAIEVTLLAFDPFFHQRGYAPDRASRIVVDGVDLFVDRAAGVDASGVSIYQAIPTSLAINIASPSIGSRTIHLQRESSRVASADVTDPAGNCLRFVAKSEQDINDPAGTGRLDVYVQGKQGRTALVPGAHFRFGGEQAEVLSITRWAGFTYSRSPGIPFVFAGFLLILAGSALLTLPAGVAQVADDGPVAAWVYSKRGLYIIVSEWNSAEARTPAPTGDLLVLPLLEGSAHA